MTQSPIYCYRHCSGQYLFTMSDHRLTENTDGMPVEIEAAISHSRFTQLSLGDKSESELESVLHFNDCELKYDDTMHGFMHLSERFGARFFTSYLYYEDENVLRQSGISYPATLFFLGDDLVYTQLDSSPHIA